MAHRDNWYLLNNERLDERMNSSLANIRIVDGTKISVYSTRNIC